MGVVEQVGIHLERAASAAEQVFARARVKVATALMPGGKLDAGLLDREQHMAHGLSWLATYAAALREMASYAVHLIAMGRFGEAEQLTAQIVAGEYLNQIAGGIPMNQGEFARLSDFGLSPEDWAPLYN